MVLGLCSISDRDIKGNGAIVGFGMTGHRSDDRNGEGSPHVESSAPPH